MDSFAAYVEHSLELITKLSSVIPLWFLVVMTGKYLLEVPLLEGPIWRSPRIPPKFTITPSRDEAKSSRPNPDRHSAPTSPNPSRGKKEAALFESARSLEPSSSSPFDSDTTTQVRQPISKPLVRSGSLSLRTSTTTAMTAYTPLELHDPLFASPKWYETTYFSTTIILLAAMLFLGILSICRSFCISQHKTQKVFLHIYTSFAMPNQTATLESMMSAFNVFGLTRNGLANEMEMGGEGGEGEA